MLVPEHAVLIRHVHNGQGEAISVNCEELLIKANRTNKQWRIIILFYIHSKLL